MSHPDSTDPDSMLLTATLHTTPQLAAIMLDPGHSREAARSLLGVCVCDNKARKQVTRKGGRGSHFLGAASSQVV